MQFERKWKNAGSLGGQETLEYRVWYAMMRRITKGQGNYTQVTCDDRFKDFDYFHEWCQEQVGFREVDNKGKIFSLDKDILSDGFGVYSPETCVFVPPVLNNLFKSSCRDLPRGVFRRGAKKSSSKQYYTSISKGGRHVYLGDFHSIEEAKGVYEAARKDYLLELYGTYGVRVDGRVWGKIL